MTINFYRKSKTKTSGIYMQYLHRGERYIYSPGLSVDPKDWNERKQRYKYTHDESDELNDQLNEISKAIKKAHSTLMARNEPITKQSIEREFLRALRGDEGVGKYFTIYVEKLIEYRKASGQYAPGSIEVYDTMLKKLQDYEAVRGVQLTFDDIDMNFRYDFLAYLKPFRFKQNYLHKIVSNIGLFMNCALGEGLHTNLRYKIRGFNLPKTETYNVYLSVEELLSIYHLDLENFPGLDRARYRFLMSAFTGLRYSDVMKITEDNYHDGKLYVNMQKGGKNNRLVIPCHPVVKALLASDLKAGKISNQKLNENIKRLCQKAKIKDPVFKDGKAYPKYKLVTTHTGRRSFATNAYLAGIDSRQIMRITGHRTEANFLKYIKITNEQAADIMAQSDFFKMPLRKVE